jgi:hypothetical protein
MQRSIPALLAEVETLPEGWALVQLDRALASGACTPTELVHYAQHSSERVQWLVVIADARATSSSNGLLRRAWYDANLPTPVVGRRLLTPEGPVVSICATDYHRFAVTTQASPEACRWLAKLGWRVVVVDEQKVRAASTAALSRYLRAEHLQHLEAASR